MYVVVEMFMDDIQRIFGPFTKENAEAFIGRQSNGHSYFLAEKLEDES